jgi:hypothetical protein
MKRIIIKMDRIILFCLVAFNISFAQHNEDNYITIAEKIVRYSLEEKEGYKLLKEFVAKYKHRLSGSEGSLKSLYWAEQQMKEMSFENVTMQPVMVPHWVRGTKESCVITKSNFLKNKKLSIASFGGSVGTSKNGLEASIVEVHSFDELLELGDKVKGKIVFYNRPMDRGTINVSKAYTDAVSQRSTGAIRASRQGAVGMIVRSVTTKYDNIPHVGSTNYVDSLPKIPAIAIGLIDADLLSEAIKKEPELKVKLTLDCETLPDEQSYNVYCDLKGSEKPDEVILLVGHSDSWDVGDGAHDDAAGCMHVLEAINILKKLNIKPKKTIRCAFIINEENGLRGAIAYGKYSEVSHEKHIAALESDLGSGVPRGFGVTTTDSLKFEKIQSWLPILNNAKIDCIKRGGGGADITRIKTDIFIGYIPEDTRYFEYHHSINDIIAEVHPNEFELGAAAIAILAYLLSDEL